LALTTSSDVLQEQKTARYKRETLEALEHWRTELRILMKGTETHPGYQEVNGTDEANTVRDIEWFIWYYCFHRNTDLTGSNDIIDYTDPVEFDTKLGQDGTLLGNFYSANWLADVHFEVHTLYRNSICRRTLGCGGLFQKLMELNRNDPSDWISGEEARPLNKTKGAGSRLVSWLQVLNDRPTVEREFTHLETLWNNLPDLLVLLWSPLFSQDVAVKSFNLQLPAGWTLAKQYRLYIDFLLTTDQKTPVKFWNYWRRLFYKKCLLTHTGLYFAANITLEEAMHLQTGMAIRMSWYLDAQGRKGANGLFYQHQLHFLSVDQGPHALSDTGGTVKAVEGITGKKTGLTN
jgi:hypothetical protein